MHCPSCNHDNRAERRFCAECGAALAALCAACGASNEPGEKFCGGCGERLSPDCRPRRHSSRRCRSHLRPPLHLHWHRRWPPRRARRPRRCRPPPAPPRPRHRLAAVDWLLLGTLLPICLFGVVMTVVHGVRGDFVVAPFLVSSAPDEQSYPMVDRLLSSPSAEASPLAVGDRLLRLEGSDLRGVSDAGFMLRWSQAAQAGARSLLLTIERGGVRSDVRVPLVPGYSLL